MTFMKGKRRFQLLFTSKERLPSCLSLGAFVLRPSQVTASEWHKGGRVMNEDNRDAEEGDGGWAFLQRFHGPGSVLSASHGLSHWILIITWCIIIFTLQMQKLGLMKINDSLKFASLGNEQTQAASPKSKQLNMLFLNLNYPLAPAVIITISYKIYVFNWSSVWRFHLF